MDTPFFLQEVSSIRLGGRMLRTLQRFVSDEGGFLLSSEAALLGTITVLGMIVGLAEVRNNVVQELGDFSQAVAWLSQDFSFTSVEDTNVPSDIATAGSTFDDSDDDQLVTSVAANGITVVTAADVDDE